MNRGSSGTVAVEYAIILPLLLTFVFGVIDVSRLMWSYATLSRAVTAASRCASVDAISCGTVAAVQTYAAGQAWGMALTASAFTVTAASCGWSVGGTLAFQFFTPWFYIAAPFGATNTLTLNASACYPV